jgi:hypothetical protein
LARSKPARPDDSSNDASCLNAACTCRPLAPRSDTAAAWVRKIKGCIFFTIFSK